MRTVKEIAKERDEPVWHRARVSTGIHIRTVAGNEDTLDGHKGKGSLLILRTTAIARTELYSAHCQHPREIATHARPVSDHAILNGCSIALYPRGIPAANSRPQDSTRRHCAFGAILIPLMHTMQAFPTDQSPVDGSADEAVAHNSERPDLVPVPQDLLMARPVVCVPHLLMRLRDDQAKR